MICQNFLQQQLFELFSSPYWNRDGQPNGLQVPRRGNITSILGGVTASLALIEAAILKKADALLVHHGWFWSKNSRALRPYECKRLHRLLEANIALLAIHLPLDFHSELGNNVQLAKQMHWQVHRPLRDHEAKICGLFGSPAQKAMTAQEMSQSLYQTLGRQPLWLCGSQAPEKITQIAWCSGAGQRFIEDAFAQGAHAFISGEVSEQTFHFVQENPIHFFCAGHHATERYGVIALGEWIKAQWGCAFEFVEIDNPI